MEAVGVEYIWMVWWNILSNPENFIDGRNNCKIFIFSTAQISKFLLSLGNKMWVAYFWAFFWEHNSLSVQFSSVAQSCPTLCDPMNRSTPGLPVHHQLPEFTQTHAHRGSDAIQPSHPLMSPSPPAPNPSQHQSFPMSRLLVWGGQSIGVSASASVLPKNTQDWSPLE